MNLDLVTYSLTYKLPNDFATITEKQEFKSMYLHISYLLDCTPKYALYGENHCIIALTAYVCIGRGKCMGFAWGA